MIFRRKPSVVKSIVRRIFLLKPNVRFDDKIDCLVIAAWIKFNTSPKLVC